MRLERELTCKQIVELVTAYLEDALDSTDRERFEEHLVFCDGCGNYLEQMRQTVLVAGQVDEQLPAELEERLLAAFRGWRA
ncbi:MAG: anti-sigma factor family protein [Gaiellaceae bacterium]|jgi:anti-sigma factor RsiW